MAGNNTKKGGSRGAGGAVATQGAAAPMQLTKKTIAQGIKTTYKAQGELVNNRGPREGAPGRSDKMKRMAARLDQRREQLFSARDNLERKERADTFRSLRRAGLSAYGRRPKPGRAKSPRK